MYGKCVCRSPVVICRVRSLGWTRVELVKGEGSVLEGQQSSSSVASVNGVGEGVCVCGSTVIVCGISEWSW